MNLREVIKPILQKGITPFLSNTKPQKRYVIIHDLLASQMSWFESLLDLLDRIPATEVTLTFDDGFHSSYEAIKRLRNRKAIFFVCPEYINRAGTSQWQEFFYKNLLRTESLNDRELLEAVRPASWDQLKELVSMGHAIGSHSMNHARLSRIVSQKELEQEIIGSAEMIEYKLGVKVNAIAYPFGKIGSIDEMAMKMIRKRYGQCFSGLRGNNYAMENQLVRWRDTIHFSWPMDYVAFLFRGGFDALYYIKRQILLHLS